MSSSLPGPGPQVGDARSDEPQDEQRNDEAQEIAEQSVIGQGDARQPVGEEEAAADARDDGGQHTCQQSEFESHGWFVYVKV